MKRVCSSAIILLSLIVISSCVFAQNNEVTTFIMVRHAEKEAGSNDPPLTPDGLRRAQRLAYMLSDIELNAVYDTPYNRTQQTAAPTAQSKALKAKTIQNLRLPALKEFIDEAVQTHRGKSVLLVSHSNIIPIMIKLIRGEEIDMRNIKYIDENVYNDIFIVSFTERKKACVLNLKYGDQTPSAK